MKCKTHLHLPCPGAPRVLMFGTEAALLDFLMMFLRS